jgi:hypothetical protein
MTKVLKEYKSSTGGTVQVFAWGIRHTAGEAYSGASVTEVPEDVAKKPRKGPGRPRNS